MSRGGRIPFYYGWVVVWAGFVGLLFAAGVRFAFSPLIKPWEAEFGWTRDAISFVGSLGLIVYGVAPALAGQLADRYGTRIVLVGGVLLAGGGAIFTSMITEIWQLAITFGILAGAGGAFGSAVTGAPMATRWFVKRRGLAVGIVTAGTAAAQMVIVPLVIFLVLSVGWRTAMLWVGVVEVAVVAPLLLLLIRSSPADIGLRPYGASEDSTGAAREAIDDARRTGLLEAMRSRDYWFMSFGFFVCGFSSLGLIITHLTPLAVGDLRLTETNVAQTLMVLGVFDVAGAILAGLLSDRIGWSIPLGSVYLLRALSFLILMNVRDPVTLVLWGIVYGMSEFASVPLVAGLSGEVFGRRSMGTIYGSIFLSHQIGAAVGAAYGGLVFRQLGSYQLAILTSIVLLLSASALSYAIREHRKLAAPIPATA